MLPEQTEILKSLISERVASGCKATELIVWVISQLHVRENSSARSEEIRAEFPKILRELHSTTESGGDYLIDLIDKMIRDKEIIELEYVLPDMPYRTKSFLMPPGTVLNDYRLGSKLIKK